MSHVKNKVDWCLKKASKERDKRGRHRGLMRVNPDIKNARKHIEKSEHYLNATLFLEKEFSDISISTVFYSVYHSLLAIVSKFGYESGNQECTFALIYSLIEDGKIDLEKEILDKISSLELGEESVISLRERYQYGVELSMKKEIFEENLKIAKKLLGKVKEIIEDEK
ncbi:MAG: HEPN domain-containing protein [Nanoarchaeota archaeon]|nr:HEPN domain-containing protein [Nanoarchaeota archaeon]